MLHKISLNHTKLLAKNHGKEIAEKVKTVVESGEFFKGEEGLKLENNLFKIFKTGNILLTASGHDALCLALQKLNLKREDEVIFPVNSYPTAFPVCLSKGRPVPVDVDKNGQLDAISLRKKINKKTKAIVVVHLYGLVGNLKEICKIEKNKNISIIEDCAQSLGSKYQNKITGTIGDIGCFSFYPTKNLGTLGDGGAIVTKDIKTYKYMLKAKSYGEKIQYQSHFLSGHSRLPEIQAGILNVFFEHLASLFAAKQKLYETLRKYFERDLTGYVRVLKSDVSSSPVPVYFVIDCKKRNKLQNFLNEKGIETAVHYPRPIHLLPAFKYLGYKKGDFPMAEKLSAGILSLPFHEFLTKDDLNYIVSSVKKFYKQ